MSEHHQHHNDHPQREEPTILEQQEAVIGHYAHRAMGLMHRAGLLDIPYKPEHGGLGTHDGANVRFLKANEVAGDGSVTQYSLHQAKTNGLPGHLERMWVLIEREYVDETGVLRQLADDIQLNPGSGTISGIRRQYEAVQNPNATGTMYFAGRSWSGITEAEQLEAIESTFAYLEVRLTAQEAAARS